jgi:hypothetical protein
VRFFTLALGGSGGARGGADSPRNNVFHQTGRRPSVTCSRIWRLPSGFQRSGLLSRWARESGVGASLCHAHSMTFGVLLRWFWLLMMNFFGRASGSKTDCPRLSGRHGMRRQRRRFGCVPPSTNEPVRLRCRGRTTEPKLHQNCTGHPSPATHGLSQADVSPSMEHGTRSMEQGSCGDSPLPKS